MIWAVLDTNILVSGIAFSGLPSKVVELLRIGQFVSITSRALLDELARILQTPKLAPHVLDPLSIVLMIERISTVVEPTNRLEVIEEDPADNRLLEGGTNWTRGLPRNRRQACVGTRKLRRDGNRHGQGVP